MFEDRVEAGNRLLARLIKYKDKKGVVVIGLTRGGIVPAKVISTNLNLKLVPLIVKKISAPGNEELAIGAMVSTEDVYWNDDLCKSLNIKLSEKRSLVLEKWKEIEFLKKQLNIINDWKNLRDKIVILVDDGVATGASVVAALNFLRKIKVKKIILVTPVISFDIVRDIKKYFDSVIFLIASRNFYSVGQFYNDFPQISNEETAKILKE